MSSTRDPAAVRPSAVVDLPDWVGEFPGWLQEMYGLLPGTAQVVLTGNVADVHLNPDVESGRIGLVRTSEIVAECLHRTGYELVIQWDPADGFTVLRDRTGQLGNLLLSADQPQSSEPSDPAELRRVMRGVVMSQQVRVTLLIVSAPRLAGRADDPGLHRLYALAHHLSGAGSSARLPTDTRYGLRNLVVWQVDDDRELPPWLVRAPGVRTVEVPLPSAATRRIGAELLAPNLHGYPALSASAAGQVLRQLVEDTDRMTLMALSAIVTTALDQGIPADRVDESARYLRSGRRSDPWCDPRLTDRVRQAEQFLSDRVPGQPHAVGKAIAVVSRAVLGIARVGGAHGRGVRGVLLLAGPPGAGRGALAEELARVVFGDGGALLRVDLAARHGRPELADVADAVRRRPFCPLLFDRFEHAPPASLDMLQRILDDGRLVDGAGRTVHFDDTLMIFRSTPGPFLKTGRNAVTAAGELRPGTPYPALADAVRAALDAECERDGWRALRYRIGDDIAVFDFLSVPAARHLLRHELNIATAELLRRTGCAVTVGPAALGVLDEELTDPGRLVAGRNGVRALIGSHILDPLARLIVASGPPSCRISRIHTGGNPIELELTDGPPSCPEPTVGDLT